MSESDMGTIVVHGGQKCAPLPPARPLDGTPDPEIERIVREGQMRYHLHTLEALASEAASVSIVDEPVIVGEGFVRAHWPPKRRDITPATVKPNRKARRAAARAR